MRLYLQILTSQLPSESLLKATDADDEVPVTELDSILDVAANVVIGADGIPQFVGNVEVLMDDLAVLLMAPRIHATVGTEEHGFVSGFGGHLWDSNGLIVPVNNLANPKTRGSCLSRLGRGVDGSRS